MNLAELRERARQFLDGTLTADQLIGAVDQSRTARWDGGTVDLDRQRRCGFPEVIYAAGKTNDDLCSAIARLIDADLPVLATRVSNEQASVVLEQFPRLHHNAVGRTLRSPHQGSRQANPSNSSPVAVVTGGASDRPVAEEAMETLHWMNVPARLIGDIGVAGPHRLVENLPELRKCAAVVAVAGMEGALPSAVGGHLACPVVAVPTSVGYGANLGGIAALLAMLNSCSANVTVVNIDAGFKGGYIAGLIATSKQSAATANGGD